MTDINTWAAIDDNNNVPSPAGWPEGMMPAGVNNSARANMGAIKRWRDQSQPTVQATGTANAQVITYPVAPAPLAAGDVFSFYSAGTNTAATTLQVNVQAAKAVRNAQGFALTGNEMLSGAPVTVVYDGTVFRIVAGTSAAAIGAVPIGGGTMTGNLQTPGLSVTGNAVVGTTLSVAGATTLAGVTASTAHVTGTAVVDGTLTAPTIAGGTISTFSLTATGGVSAATLSSTGNANVAGTVTAPYVSGLLLGGVGNAGELRTYNTPNVVSFRWDSAKLHYRIDNTLESGPLAMAADVDGLVAQIQQLMARVAALEAAR